MLGRHAVSVLSRIETSPLTGHVAPDVRECVFGDLEVEGIARSLRRFDVREHQLRLVVQHLLEMGDAPGGVDRIAVKPPADVIADPAGRHRAERAAHHAEGLRIAGPRMFPEEKEQLARPRKLRRVAKPAVSGVVRRPKLHDDPRQHVGRRLRRGGGRPGALAQS